MPHTWPHIVHTPGTHEEHTMPHTRTHTQNPTPKRRRRRPIPYIFGNDRLETLFERLLNDRGPELRLYVYRFRDGQKSKPGLFIGRPSPRLIDWLRDEQDGGDFWIIIRRGKRIEISGVIGIVGPNDPIPEELTAFAALFDN